MSNRNRLPNEHNSNVPMASRNRLLQEENVCLVVDRISEEMKRPLDKMEISAVMSHIKRLDGNRFARMPIKQAVDQIALGYITIATTKNDSIIDTHEVMKQYIGGDVKPSPDRFTIQKNAGTTNGLENDPSSFQHTGGYMGAYAQFPRIEGIPGRVAPLPIMNSSRPNGDKPVVQRGDSDLVILSANDDAGVPIHGAYVKKNNIIKSRKKNLTILLDSRYRVRTTSPNIFTWTISDAPSNSRGVVSTQSPMSNIISMKFDEFFIPYVAAADNSYKKITLLIEDLGMSSIMCHENRHYHMMFDTEIVTNRIKLIPQNCGIYHFNEPIDHFKRVAISFADPLNPLGFLPDYYSVTIASNGPASTYIIFRVKHYISDGEIVLISGFTTENPNLDFNTISLINAPAGNTVAVVDDYTLEIAVDTSLVTMATEVPSIEAYIVSRRVFIPITFSYM